MFGSDKGRSNNKDIAHLNDLKGTFVFGVLCEERSNGHGKFIAGLLEFGFRGEDHCG